jgi:hypothetical protein
MNNNNRNREYITINSFDLTEIRKYKNMDSALKDSIELNKSDENHPRFLLYRNQASNIEYVGSLRRVFGTDNFFFVKEEII